MTDAIRIKLQERQEELLKILRAFTDLAENRDWQILQENVFSKSLQSIERQLLTEAEAPEINIAKLYHLQGERAWARQYSDLPRYIENLKKQLEDIKIKLHQYE